MLCSESQFVFEQDDGSKFGSVIFNVEAILFTLYDSVASGNTDVIDSDLTFMTSTQFEFGLILSYSQKMDVS
jgi:hypothetical protein